MCKRENKYYFMEISMFWQFVRIFNIFMNKPEEEDAMQICRVIFEVQQIRLI